MRLLSRVFASGEAELSPFFQTAFGDCGNSTRFPRNGGAAPFVLARSRQGSCELLKTERGRGSSESLLFRNKSKQANRSYIRLSRRSSIAT